MLSVSSQLVMLLSATLCLLSSSLASFAGQATFYGGNTHGGMCSFPGYDIPSGLYGTALSDFNWNHAIPCGSCVLVNGPKGSIRVMIVDQCPGCGQNHLDLYQNAFGAIANPSKGIVSVTWDYVPCGIISPLFIRNKSGTSKRWFSMQAVNSNIAISALDVSIDGGHKWQSTVRRDHNYFEKNGGGGFGTDSVDVRLSATNGRQMIVRGMSVASEARKLADGNF